MARPSPAGAAPLHRRLLWPLLLATAMLVAGCASPPTGEPLPRTDALARPQDTTLGRNFAARLAGTAEHSALHLLVAGSEAFAARAALAISAERTLDLQYHIVEADTTATLLIYQALRAAERGVRVRLLIDDISSGFDDSDLAVLAAHPNVEIRLFNPFTTRGPLGLTRLLEFLGNSERLNRRMHNKLWIADNAVLVMGGRNLGDAYFDALPDSGFADLDVLVAGPVVAQISSSFDHYWNSDWSVPIEAFHPVGMGAERLAQAMAEMEARATRFRQGEYADSLRATEFARRLPAAQLPLLAAKATALVDLPGDRHAAVPDKSPAIFPALRQVVEQARDEVILVSPYFVPNDFSVGVLCALPRRGVRVRVLTNSLASTDVPVVHAGYARYRPRLLACGVELHELRPAEARRPRSRLSSGGSLHAKAVVVDRHFSIIGSMNLDPRSRQLNTEVALHAESAELGQQLGALFDEATAPDQAFRVELAEPGNADSALRWTSAEDGLPARYTVEPLASLWRRFYVPIIGALTPEALL